MATIDRLLCPWGHPGLACEVLQQPRRPDIDRRLVGEPDQVTGEVTGLWGAPFLDHPPQVAQRLGNVGGVGAVPLTVLPHGSGVEGHRFVKPLVHRILLDVLDLPAPGLLPRDICLERQGAGVHLDRPLGDLVDDVVVLTGEGKFQRLDSKLPVGGDRRLRGCRAKEISEKVSKRAKLLSQPGAHVLIPTRLAHDDLGVAVAGCGTRLNATYYRYQVRDHLRLVTLIERVVDPVECRFHQYLAFLSLDGEAFQINRCPPGGRRVLCFNSPDVLLGGFLVDFDTF